VGAQGGHDVRREEAQRVGALEIHQDLSFERRNWRVQRAGWAVMALFVLAGLTGGFGRGPLSDTDVTSSGGLLRLGYERFTRHGSPTKLRFTVAPGGIDDDTVRLLVSRPFLEGQQIEDIQPDPEWAVVSADRVTYAFHVRPGEPAHILIRLTPDAYALRHAEVSLADGREAIRVWQFVFP